MCTCNHAPISERNERGIVLVAALVLAVLYFALMELMMVDASRSLQEAQRFRARVVAQTLAENGVELAAVQMAAVPAPVPSYSDDQGLAKGTLQRSPAEGDDIAFYIIAEGSAAGVVPQKATVKVQGRIDRNRKVIIDYADHSQ